MISCNYLVGKLKYSKFISEIVWFEWFNYFGFRYFIVFCVYVISVWFE